MVHAYYHSYKNLPPVHEQDTLCTSPTMQKKNCMGRGQTHKQQQTDGQRDY